MGGVDGQLTFRRMAHDGSDSVEILQTSIHELWDVDNTVVRLARRMQEFADRLDKAFVPQHGRPPVISWWTQGQLKAGPAYARPIGTEIMARPIFA